MFNELHYANKTEDDKDKGGFLVYKPNEEELRETINNDSNIVLVAKDGKQVVGYALAYNLSEWKKDNPEWDANLDISNIDECLYFRHIARLPGYKKVGLKLEENTEELAREMGYSSVFADISEANQFSRKVHINRGYKNARETTKDDGSAWGTFVKPLYKGNQNLN